MTIYRGYEIKGGRNAFEQTIFVVTKGGQTPLYTDVSEESAMAWIDVKKRQEAGAPS